MFRKVGLTKTNKEINMPNPHGDVPRTQSMLWEGRKKRQGVIRNTSKEKQRRSAMSHEALLALSNIMLWPLLPNSGLTFDGYFLYIPAA